MRPGKTGLTGSPICLVVEPFAVPREGAFDGTRTDRPLASAVRAVLCVALRLCEKGWDPKRPWHPLGCSGFRGPTPFRR